MHMHEKTNSEMTISESSDLVATAEASVLRADYRVHRGTRTTAMTASFHSTSVAGIEPSRVAAALSLLLHRRPPLPQVLF